VFLSWLAYGLHKVFAFTPFYKHLTHVLLGGRCACKRASKCSSSDGSCGKAFRCFDPDNQQRCFETVNCNEQSFPFRAQMECANGENIQGFSNRKVQLRVWM
jgi:hypothetical protein